MFVHTMSFRQGSVPGDQRHWYSRRNPKFNLCPGSGLNQNSKFL